MELSGIWTARGELVTRFKMSWRRYMGNFLATLLRGTSSRHYFGFCKAEKENRTRNNKAKASWENRIAQEGPPFPSGSCGTEREEAGWRVPHSNSWAHSFTHSSSGSRLSPTPEPKEAQSLGTESGRHRGLGSTCLPVRWQAPGASGVCTRGEGRT